MKTELSRPGTLTRLDHEREGGVPCHSPTVEPLYKGHHRDPAGCPV